MKPDNYLERRILHLMKVIEDMRDEALLTGVIGLSIGTITGYLIKTMAG
jgi:hypothetical protein